MKPMQIIIVDDNAKFRASLRELLTKRFKYEVIGEAESGKEFLTLENNWTPDIILMDLSMPNVNGFEATKKYFWHYPNSKIIAVTASLEIAFLDKLIEAGFKGCVYKDNIFSEIHPAVNAVMSGKLWFKHVDKISV